MSLKKQLVVALGLLTAWCQATKLVGSFTQIYQDSNKDCSIVKTLYKTLGGSYSFEGFDCCGWNFVDCSDLDVITFYSKSKPYVQINKKSTWGPDQFDDYPCETSEDSYCDVDFRKSNTEIGSGFVTINYSRMSFSCTESNCTVSTEKTPRVTAIYWKKQSLTGTISPIVQNLTRLRVLSLSDNYIRGSIPKEIGTLKELQGLELDGNSLTGTIPSTITSLPRLSRLSLSNNMLTGAIPDDIGNMRALNSIELSNNKFGGPIPRSIYTLPSLVILNLEKNFFSGNIFPGLVHPTRSLIRLSLANNVLTGIIPSRIGTLTNLTYLSLAGNQLEGSIPREIGSLTSLDWLQLSGNHLNGTVPTEIGNLSSLTTMDLSDNRLNGAFPSLVSRLRNLQYLRVEKNLFTSMPASIGNMTWTTSIVLPNPLTSVSQTLVARNPSYTLSPNDWLGILNNSSLSKRQAMGGTSTTLRADELFAYCPLSDVTNPEVPAGCIAGIYKKYCTKMPFTVEAFSRCHKTYEKVFDVSIFKSLGNVCPAWKEGPRSAACLRAVSTFNVNLGYIVVTSQMASDLVMNIFGSRLFAPCVNVGNIVCKW